MSKIDRRERKRGREDGGGEGGENAGVGRVTWLADDGWLCWLECPRKIGLCGRQEANLRAEDQKRRGERKKERVGGEKESESERKKDLIFSLRCCL